LTRYVRVRRRRKRRRRRLYLRSKEEEEVVAVVKMAVEVLPAVSALATRAVLFSNPV